MKVLSMRGVPVDLGRLMAQNESAIAIGNASMNARGDVIGRNGKVVKRRETVAQEYYAVNPKAVKHVPLRSISPDVFTFASPEDALAAVMKPAAQQQAAQPAAKQPGVPTPRKRIKEED